MPGESLTAKFGMTTSTVESGIGTGSLRPWSDAALPWPASPASHFVGSQISSDLPNPDPLAAEALGSAENRASWVHSSRHSSVRCADDGASCAIRCLQELGRPLRPKYL